MFRAVPEPSTDRGALNDVLRLVTREAEAYLEAVDTALVQPPGAQPTDSGLPSEGVGSLQAVTELIAASLDGATRSTGPRYFHYVTGGVTPAALAADWLASALDQHAYNWVGSPFASRLEQISLGWLKELFGLPAEWSAVLTTGGTASNFVGLAAARRWWGLKHEVDIDTEGFARLPPVPVFASGYLHASAAKPLAIPGILRHQPQTFSPHAAGPLDLDALAAALEGLRGKPAILIATPGVVNTGDFDPLAQMADLAGGRAAWLHVDGAVGLFAATSPLTRHPVQGIDRAHSVAADGHEWLNVPYESGFDFVRDPVIHAGAFSATAAY